MADASLFFNLIGRDRLSPVISDAVRDSNGRLRDLNSRFITESTQMERRARIFGVRMPGLMFGGLPSGLSGLPGFMGPIGALAGTALGVGVVGSASTVVLGGLAALAASGAQVLAAGGVLGIGVALAAQTEQVKTAAADMKSAFTDAFAPLGEILAPAVADALGIFQTLAQPISDALRPVLESLEPAIRPLAQGLTDLVTNALPGFTALAASGAPFFEMLGPLLPQIGTALSGLMTTMAGAQPLFQDLFVGSLEAAPAIIGGVATGMQFLMDAFAGVVAGFREGDASGSGVFGAFERVGAGARELIDTVTRLWDGPFGQQLRSAGAQVFDFLAQVSPTFMLIKALISGEGVDGAGLQSKFQPIITGFMSIVTAVQTRLPVIIPMVQDIAGKLMQGFQTVADFMGPVFDQIIGIVGSALELIGAIIGPVLGRLAELWQKHGDSITQIVTGLWTAVSSVISGALTVIQGVLDVFVGLFTGDWDRMGHGLMQIWRGLWHAVEGLLRGAWGIIGGLATMIAQTLREGFNRAKDWVIGAWTSMMDRVRSAGESFGAYIKGLPERWLTALGNMAIRFYSVGSDIIDGIKNGVRDRAVGLANSVGDAVKGAYRAATGFLDTGSPSKLFRDEVGVQMMAGAEQGVQAGAPALARATEQAMPFPQGAARAGGNVARGAAQGVPTVRLEVSDTKVGRLLVELMRDGVRARGGNVQVVLGGAA